MRCAPRWAGAGLRARSPGSTRSTCSRRCSARSSTLLTRPRPGRRRSHRMCQPGRRAVGDARSAGAARRRLADPRPVGDDRTQVRLRPAGGRVRRGGHRGRAVRHRRGRRGRVHEPGADGVRQDGQGPVRAEGAGGAWSWCHRGSRPNWWPSAGASAGPGSTSMPPARTRGPTLLASTVASRTRSCRFRGWIFRRRGRRDDPGRNDRPAPGRVGARFRLDEMVARFPDVEWKVTAGNSSQLTDGARLCC